MLQWPGSQSAYQKLFICSVSTELFPCGRHGHVTGTGGDEDCGGMALLTLALGTVEPSCGQLQVYPYGYVLCTHTSSFHTCKEMPLSAISLTLRTLGLVLRQSLVGEGLKAMCLCLCVPWTGLPHGGGRRAVLGQRLLPPIAESWFSGYSLVCLPLHISSVLTQICLNIPKEWDCHIENPFGSFC